MRMDFTAVRDAIDIPTEAGEIVAHVVASTYWGSWMPLKDLDRLDPENYRLALNVLGYRREPGWDDDKFWALARYADRRIQAAKNNGSENGILGTPGETIAPAKT